jgi:hypothetical protein
VNVGGAVPSGDLSNRDFTRWPGASGRTAASHIPSYLNKPSLYHGAIGRFPEIYELIYVYETEDQVLHFAASNLWCVGRRDAPYVYVYGDVSVRPEHVEGRTPQLWFDKRSTELTPRSHHE